MTITSFLKTRDLGMKVALHGCVYLRDQNKIVAFVQRGYEYDDQYVLSVIKDGEVVEEREVILD